MKLYPVNVIDFQDMFPTEQACEEYLFAVRWPEGFVCPTCMHTEAWKLGSGLLRCQDCSRDVSLTAGSIFQGSRLSLRLWFQALWYVVCSKQGVSALALKSILGLGSYKTAWECLHKLRRAMVRPGRDRLSGLVEVDEILIGGPQKGRFGRDAYKKALVLVAVEDKEGEMGRIRLVVIPNASRVSLARALKEMVEPGSTMRTDGWHGYEGLKKEGYGHLIITKDTAPDTENLTPLVHRVSSLLKRWLLNTHQGGVQRTHLPYYLDEFVFRFNRCTSRSRGLLFYRLMQNALALDPVPAAQLKAS
jgi:transposase-like protein